MKVKQFKTRFLSVLSLEYPEKEIIIINDGSSDNTAEIIYEFKKNHDF